MAKIPGRDGRVLGLIGAGHFLSHFYGLTLPPLLILWRAEFGVSFAALGLVISLFGAATGLAQIPAGFLVDKVGARSVLFAGLLVISAAFGAMGLVTSFEALLLLAFIAGIANSVFHPADYSILNSSISPGRMGRAFSLHTFAGHLGSATAPAVIIFLTALRDWRFALITVGIIGIAAAFLVLSQSAILDDDTARGEAAKQAEEGPAEARPPAEARQSALQLLLTRPLLLFFLFYILMSVFTSGVQAFSVVAMIAVHEIELTSASAALTAFLFASAAGILAGGMMADRTVRHGLIAAFAFIVSAVIFGLLGSLQTTAIVLIAAFTLAGFLQGTVRPARDMMVRALAPKGASGRVFAFVSTGLAVGSAVAPVFFGLVVDNDGARWVFWILALIMVAATATLAAQQRAEKSGGR